MTQTAVEERLLAFDTATVYEANGQGGAPSGLVCLTAGTRAAGRARIARCEAGDNLALHAAVAAAEPGDVVVGHCPDDTYGVWGELLTAAAQARGVAALVVDACVRDIDAIRARGFPVFARGLALKAATKTLPGALDVEIDLGGVAVRPGDYVLADESGVVVVRADDIVAVLERAAERRARETELIARLAAGETTLDLLDLRPYVE